jgi:hypothetical protein
MTRKKRNEAHFGWAAVGVIKKAKVFTVAIPIATANDAA